MINFNHLVKERDAAKLLIDEINSRIDTIRHNEGIVPHTLNQELISTEEYHKQLILRIGRSLTEENVAVPVTVVNFGPEEFNDSKVENMDDIPFNLADILKAIDGVEVSEESSEDDEEQCGCKDCTSEDDDNAEDILDTIVKAFLLKGAINAIEAKKEGK